MFYELKCSPGKAINFGNNARVCFLFFIHFQNYQTFFRGCRGVKMFLC